MVGESRRETAEAGELIFEEDGLYGHLSVPNEPASATRLDVYHYGVLVGVEDLGRGLPSVVGKVDGRALGLNASQSGVVKDARFEALVQRTRARARDLLAKVADEQAASLPRALKLMRGSEALKDLWVRRATQGSGVEAEELEPDWPVLGRLLHHRPDRQELALVLREACATLWLRDAVDRLVARGEKVAGGLAQAPIFLSPELEPMSLTAVRGHGRPLLEGPAAREVARRLSRAA